MTNVNKFTSKRELWEVVEGMATEYRKETDSFTRQKIMGDIFQAMERYIKTCVNNSAYKAKNYGIEIPKEDFESRYFEYLWEALEVFKKEDGKVLFKNIVLRRFRLAEIHTWKQYQTKGDENDKDGISYDSVRWDSLDKKVGSSSGTDKTLVEMVVGDEVSAEDEFINENEELEILSAYEKVNERYSNVIRYMGLGYEGIDLAIATGESDKYDAKVRKLVQRAKNSFEEFMKDYYNNKK